MIRIPLTDEMKEARRNYLWERDAFRISRRSYLTHRRVCASLRKLAYKTWMDAGYTYATTRRKINANVD